MTTIQIELGKNLLNKMAVENNITTKTSEIELNKFLTALDIKFSQFILSFKNHPFSIIRGYVMFKN